MYLTQHSTICKETTIFHSHLYSRQSQSTSAADDDAQLCALVDQIEKDLVGRPVEMSSSKPSEQVPSKLRKASETILPPCTPDAEPSTDINIYQVYVLPKQARPTLHPPGYLSTSSQHTMFWWDREKDKLGRVRMQEQLHHACRQMWS